MRSPDKAGSVGSVNPFWGSLEDFGGFLLRVFRVYGNHSPLIRAKEVTFCKPLCKHYDLTLQDAGRNM